MELPPSVLEAWPRLALCLLGAGRFRGRAGRGRHRPHDAWNLLLLLEGEVEGRDQHHRWIGRAPCTWLLPPAHPANDYFGSTTVTIASVLFDAVPLPGWPNPLLDLPLPSIVPCRHAERTEALLQVLIEPCRAWRVVDQGAAVAARPELERLLLDHLADGLASGAYAAGGRPRPRNPVERALEDVRRHWHDPDLDVPAMARIAGLSVSGFAHACRRVTGLPPRAWLRQQRMRQAQRLLNARTDSSVREISLRCGYRSLPLFCRHLRQETGLRARDLRPEQGSDPGTVASADAG